jgi:osmotically-inducible protein OsmY
MESFQGAFIMLRKSWVLVAAALGLGLTLGIGSRGTGDEQKDQPPATTAPQPKSTGEVISDKVDKAVQSLKKGAQSASETVKEEYNKARTAVHDMSIHSRVYSRLHWDKDLAGCKIDPQVHEGAVTLQGTVKSLQAKAKAVLLTRDTIGVERVDDRLSVEAAAPVGKAQP